MINRHAGRCVVCSILVSSGEGEATQINDGGRLEVRCADHRIGQRPRSEMGNKILATLRRKIARQPEESIDARDFTVTRTWFIRRNIDEMTPAKIVENEIRSPCTYTSTIIPGEYARVTRNPGVYLI